MVNPSTVKSSCVYCHKFKNEIVYIGSGSVKRRLSKAHRTKEHLKIWDSLEKCIITSNLTLDEARNLEQDLLNEHWSKGKLLNRIKKVAKTNYIDPRTISDFLYYDPTSPSFLRWKVNVGGNGCIKKDSVAGNLYGKYYRIKLHGKVYPAGRIIVALHHNTPVDVNNVVDHIDGNSLNNSISNLRVVSYSENQHNRTRNPNRLGERNITEDVLKQNFRVYWRENIQTKYITFSYNPKPNGRLKNIYPDRELALEASILFRDMLIDSKLIFIVTRKD